MYPVITISREFGSGGHSIGKKVAQKLNIPFLDQEIVNQVAEESGYAREMVEEQGEHASAANKWFDLSAAGAMYFQSPQDEIFIIQKKVYSGSSGKRSLCDRWPLRGLSAAKGRYEMSERYDPLRYGAQEKAGTGGATARSKTSALKTYPEEGQTAQDLLSLLHRSGVGQLPQL